MFSTMIYWFCCCIFVNIALEVLYCFLCRVQSHTLVVLSLVSCTACLSRASWFSLTALHFLSDEIVPKWNDSHMRIAWTQRQRGSSAFWRSNRVHAAFSVIISGPWDSWILVLPTGTNRFDMFEVIIEKADMSVPGNMMYWAVMW
jgi:hypothetical protein